MNIKIVSFLMLAANLFTIGMLTSKGKALQALGVCLSHLCRILYSPGLVLGMNLYGVNMLLLSS